MSGFSIGDDGRRVFRAAGRALHEILGQWADVSPARLVNRYVAMGSNFSKPYQAQLIREHGFDLLWRVAGIDLELAPDGRIV